MVGIEETAWNRCEHTPQTLQACILNVSPEIFGRGLTFCRKIDGTSPIGPHCGPQLTYKLSLLVIVDLDLIQV